MPSNDDLWTGGDVYVFPRYLAGLPGHAAPSFAPVAHWPHHRPDVGPCQLVITSPDHRIRIGWFGDDHDTWLISAAQDPVSAPCWTARINQNTPPEIVEGLTRALAAEWDADSDSFLTRPSVYWSDAVQPLLDAGWDRKPLLRGTVEIVSPDGLAGASIDVVSTDPDAETVTLWAGPPGWGTRAEATFTARTPKRRSHPRPPLRGRSASAARQAGLARPRRAAPPGHADPAGYPACCRIPAPCRCAGPQRAPMDHQHTPAHTGGRLPPRASLLIHTTHPRERARNAPAR